jgi:hypothetical protein
MLLSGASAHYESACAANGLNEIPQLRDPIINEPDTISASTSPTVKPEAMNDVKDRNKAKSRRKPQPLRVLVRTRPLSL